MDLSGDELLGVLVALFVVLVVASRVWDRYRNGLSKARARIL